MKKIHLLILLFTISVGHFYAQNVGVGTTSPTHKLHVKGQLRIDTLSTGLGTDSVIVADPSTGLFKRISPSTLLNSNAANTTAGSLITISGGTGATLKSMTVSTDTTALKSFVAKSMNSSPMKDSITNTVNTVITSGSISGKTATAGSLITVTNGAGATLKDMTVSADTTAMKSFIATNVNKSPIKDSLSTVINNQITTGTITGQNLTNSNGIIVIGGTGTTIKATSLRLDSTAVAKMMSQSPAKDSLTSVVNTVINSGAGITGKNTTAGSLITVTNGAGSALKDHSISVDTTAMKSFIATNVNKSPIKDSLSTVINNQITTGTITGQNLTNSNGIIVIGGTGTTIKATSLRLDSTAVAKMMSQSPAKDSLTSVVNTVINSGAGITGKNTTAGSLITVTNGAGSALKDHSISVDTTAMKTFVATNVNKSPIKDSITTLVSSINSSTNITANVAATVPALSIGDAGSITLTVSGAAVGNVAVVSPATDMPNGVVIAYARVSAANTVKVGFVGTGSSTSFSANFDVRVFK